jgi:protease-4
MSEVAGSGGYWIATVGRRLFAEETTLTGSIGVIAATLDASDLMRREGVAGEAVRTAPRADRGAAYRRPTDEELRIAEAEVDQYYRAFLDHVASFRKTSPEDIDEVGQGRIWSGRDAVERGLVDAVGGLRDALEAARGEIAAKRTRVDFYPRAKLNLVERLIAGGVSARLGDALAAALAGPRPGAALDGSEWTALPPHSHLHSLRPLHLLVRYAPFVSGRPLAVVPELWDMWRNP